MTQHPSRTTRLKAVASYLEQEFPGHVEAATENDFMISHQGMQHHVVLDPTFLKQCPDYTHALRETELADYVRESRFQARRFLVMWHEHDTHIRSTSVAMRPLGPRRERKL
jgi:hypothetical protein